MSSRADHKRGWPTLVRGEKRVKGSGGVDGGVLGCVQGPSWSVSYQRRMAEYEEDRSWPWWSRVRGEEEDERRGRGV